MLTWQLTIINLSWSKITINNNISETKNKINNKNENERNIKINVINTVVQYK